MADASGEAPKAPRRVLTRRRLLQGGAALLGLGALEYESLSGNFDHSRRITIEGESRFETSLSMLTSDPIAARGSIIHVGHSTHLIVVDGVRLITDPWFYDPAFGAMRHEHPLPASPHAFESLDAILVTHEHPDHFDIRAMWAFPKHAVCLVATDALAAQSKNAGFTDVHVLRAWETFQLTPAAASADATAKRVTVTAVPALHDIYEIGFVVEGGGTSVYFAGDSQLHPALAEIAERFAPAASILSVDGTRLRGESLAVMRPEDAVIAARTLKSRVVMPSHAEGILFDPLAKYVLTENIDHPGKIFADLCTAGLPGIRCALPQPGDLVTFAI